MTKNDPNIIPKNLFPRVGGPLFGVVFVLLGMRAQDGSQRAFTWLKKAPGGLQEGPKAAKMAPRGPMMAPRWPLEGSKNGPDSPRWP